MTSLVESFENLTNVPLIKRDGFCICSKFMHPRKPHPKVQRGFSLIELIIVVFIISTLFAVFTNRVWYYQEMAEKTSMEENVGAIQSALTMQQGKNYVRGNSEDLGKLTTENPMNWLQKRPQNYVGEFYAATPKSVAPGSWVFDLKSRELIYVLDRSDHFVPGKDGGKWIRFHVTAQYEQIKSGGTEGQGKELVGLDFEPSEHVDWFKSL